MTPPPERSADIHIEKLTNGYWLATVRITTPALLAPHEDRGDRFHDAAEALAWAEQQIRTVVAYV